MTEYDPAADFIGSWLDAIAEMKRRHRAAELRAAIASVEHYREHSIVMRIRGIYTLAVDGTLYALRKELAGLEAGE